MKKIKIILFSVWIVLVGIISPCWIDVTYIFLTGHGKGYAYDMGSEADIAVIFGVAMLMIWIGAVATILISLCRYYYKKRVSI